MRNNSLPIAEMLEKAYKDTFCNMHMPGHKSGRGFIGSSSSDVVKALEEIARYDTTELPITDNIYNAERAFLEAQKLCAEAYGVCDTIFLANGTTTGILSAIGSCCRQNDKIIMFGGCHKSVYNAIKLFKLQAFVLKSAAYDELEGILSSNAGSIKAVIVTRPDYYGMCVDIKLISEIARKYNTFLIVDEAHGAHLKFAHEAVKSFPESSVKYADIIVQSAHKTLAALTQSSWLHINSDRVNMEKLMELIATFQSSSPSFLLLASLDYARYDMVKRGNQLFNELYKNLINFNKAISEQTGFEIVKSLNHTPDRIVVDVSTINITGYEFERLLLEKYNISIEMSDYRNIVILTSAYDDEESLKLIESALIEIWNEYKDRFEPNKEIPQYTSDISVIFPADYGDKKELIKLEEASGKILAENLIPYPPGVPAAFEGEYIKPELIDYLLNIIGKGAIVNGIYEKQFVKAYPA